MLNTPPPAFCLEHNTSTMARPRKFVVGKLSARSKRLSSLAASSNPPTYSLSRELVAIAELNGGSHDLDYTDLIVRRYNTILPFTSRSRRQLDDIQEGHQQIAATRNRIEETWQTCLDTINALESDLSWFAECQEELILDDHRWYEKANVFGGSSLFRPLDSVNKLRFRTGAHERYLRKIFSARV